MSSAAAFAAGVGVAIAVCLFARVTGFDRDRSFYPTVLTVIGLLYVLFAAIDGSARALVPETAGMIVFVALAVAGFKRSLWIVAFGLAAHGVFDFFHPAIIANAGVPAWWPAFCGACDIALAAWVSLSTRQAP